MATFRPHKGLVVCCVDEGRALKLSFLRQKLCGAFMNTDCSDLGSADGGRSRVFDPADLEMLKTSASVKRDKTSKSELVTLFRSRLNVVCAND